VEDGSKEGASSDFRPSLSLARANNSLSTTGIRPEGHCQALAELVVTRAGCWLWLLGEPGEGAHLAPRRAPGAVRFALYLELPLVVGVVGAAGCGAYGCGCV
jgi:hypothetical protein